MTDLVIKAEGLGKQYRIGATREKYHHFRDALVNSLRAPFRRLAQLSGKSGSHDEMFWALKDVSFDVRHGEVLGIIGRNGAGKSTLLKILARVTEPTEGYADIYGRVGSLLEVGTGFHPELTGRENIYLSGAVLGMRKAEIERKLDEIVDFAGVEKFLDTPAKRYSSGMYVRLAFAVAAHLEPEILLVDEVLAVGDAEFQKKCLGKMENVAKGGRTVLFVSHNMTAVRRLCGRVAVIDSGKLIAYGDCESTIAEYNEIISIKNGSSLRIVGEKLTVEKVELKNAQGKISTDFAPGSQLTVEISYLAHCTIKKPYFWLTINHPYGGAFIASMLFDDFRPDYLEGAGKLSCTFDSIPILPQFYSVKLGIQDGDGMSTLIDAREVAFFNVTGCMEEIGFPAPAADSIVWQSLPTVIPYEWTLPKGESGHFCIKRVTEENKSHESE